MKSDRYVYSTFIPKAFSVGMDDRYCGFPSMRLKDGKWTNAGFFEKHCGGYKPYVQRDAEKEIMKAVTQKVQEVDNVPTEGFKLLSLHGTYNNTDLYKGIFLVKLQDPRGWSICIDINDFQSLLSKNGFNLKDGVLAGLKLMYSWRLNANLGAPFSLVIADEAAKEIKAATIKHVASIDETDFIKPSQYEVGKVYSSEVSKVAGCKCMYLGMHDVYSGEVHLKAVMRKDYSDLPKFEKDRTDITGKKHVFYCLCCNPSDAQYGLLSNSPAHSPYYVISSLSKLFEKVEDLDGTEYKMYNDESKPVTLANVKADMEVSAMFNKLDLSDATKLYRSYADVDYQLFEDVFSFFNGWNNSKTAAKTFPFSTYYTGMFLRSECCNVPFTVGAYGVKERNGQYKIMRAVVDGEYDPYYNYDRTIKEYAFHDDDEARAAFKKMHYDYAPRMVQYFFENGKPVPPYQNLMLNRHKKYYDIKN